MRSVLPLVLLLLLAAAAACEIDRNVGPLSPTSALEKPITPGTTGCACDVPTGGALCYPLNPGVQGCVPSQFQTCVYCSGEACYPGTQTRGCVQTPSQHCVACPGHSYP